MEAFRAIVRLRSGAARANLLSKIVLENVSIWVIQTGAELIPQDITLFKAQLNDLRQDLSSKTRTELAAISASASAIKREMEVVEQKMQEDITALRHE
jgi:hypothetical protein